ncbi:hypothetical protein [Candidatus Uabimicrobium sp. HlEnr_7]|uniref:hypothetical protein n=1 Tax=Candidatus Uabimicrobium helgolandensis TaxID=3095367 RepID=UPI0035587F5F
MTPEEIANLAEKCIDNYLTKNDVDFALMKININPQKIDSANNGLVYYQNVIKYLHKENKLHLWLQSLANSEIAFVRDYLKSENLPEETIQSKSDFSYTFTAQELFDIAELLAKAIYDRDTIEIVISLTNDIKIEDFKYIGVPKKDWLYLLERANTRVTNRVAELVSNALKQDSGHVNLVAANKKVKAILNR